MNVIKSKSISLTKQNLIGKIFLINERNQRIKREWNTCTCCICMW